MSLFSHRKRGYDVKVTIDECLEINHKYCYYCGCELEWEYGTGFSNCSPTIDRLNNENTLTKDNIVFACHRCNLTKSDRTLLEFVEYCKQIIEKFYGSD